ncbi:hypothetical protein GCM10010246_06790 [Streptomyces cuspidosporus]|uniref:Uncharacterized protein n=1 Tax=Streptomyces cuspidosporus TaxID=66882 RepID=A0ABN3FDS1_9ACTN
MSDPARAGPSPVSPCHPNQQRRRANRRQKVSECGSDLRSLEKVSAALHGKASGKPLHAPLVHFDGCDAGGIDR